MKATPGKSGSTPAKGGGLFSFGFSKKAPTPQSSEPKAIAIDLNDIEEVENVPSKDVVSISSSGKRAQAMASTEDQPIAPKPVETKSKVNPAKVDVKETTNVRKEQEAPSKKESPIMKDNALGKKRRIVLDEEEEEADFAIQKPEAAKSDTKKRTEMSTPAPTKRKAQSKLSDSDASSISDEEDSEDDSEDSLVDEEEDEAPSAKKKKATPRPASSSSSKSAPGSASQETVGRQGVFGAGEHEHDFLPWFQEHRDSSMRLPNHPEYDPSTMFVPPGYLEGKPAFHAPGSKPRKITDAMRVWWDFFSRNADCVIAFKVGKFYEMYHSSTDVAVKHCDLLYMRGETAHCGFPEIAWAKNMSKLVNANYRVARIEQTETPEAMQERTGKKSGMVRREVCQVLSPGTMTLSVRDCGDGFVPRPDGRVQLLSVSETEKVVGVCVLDATTGKFRVGEFANDEHRVGLRACLAFETPAEIVYVPSKLTSVTQAVLKSETKALHTTFPPSKQLTSCDWRKYFSDAPNDVVPEFLVELASTSPVANQALFNCVKVLQRALVDEELITMGRFTRYHTPTAVKTEEVVQVQQESDKDVFADGAEVPLLRMDAQALRHLEIVANSTDGSKEGTLLEYLDRAKSPFGQRLLREWVTRPLASIAHVLERQTAVRAILELINDNSVGEFRRALQHSPDLERNLSKIHAIGLAKKKNHPDTRAVIYGADEVNKNKIETLCSTLNALKGLRVAGEKLATVLHGSSTKSKYLTRLLEDLTSALALERLEHFDRAFDAKQAKKTGIIEPRTGVAPKYDEAVRAVTDVKTELNEYLAKMKKQLGLQISYYSPAQGKQRFQMEVQETKSVPRDWTMASKRKGFKRYISPELKDLTLDLEKAEQNLAENSVDVTRTVFAEFDKYKVEWLRLVRAAAEIDCLLSLALVSCESVQSCIPELVVKTPQQGPFLELIQARHPCVAAGLDRLGKNSFIPNDTVLDSMKGRCMLLTGPNMGGKSTLLRQTCLAIIVAQIGCFVQAESYRGTIVDAIFTRVGASDRILEGQSTFFVELSETATILHNATEDSFVILDELGRGTSTFDGTAIAHSVINKLMSIGCRTMFATHYHSLVREVGRSKGVSLGHMACVAEGDQSDPDKQDVTFLYKLEEGASDRSYGLNVAKLARLPHSIIKRAHVMSQRFEHAFERHLRRRLVEELSELCEKGDAKRLRLAVQRAECFVTG